MERKGRGIVSIPNSLNDLSRTNFSGKELFNTNFRHFFIGEIPTLQVVISSFAIVTQNRKYSLFAYRDAI